MYYGEALHNLHTLPIYFKKHAALMLIHRFELSLSEVKHCIKTAKIVKPVEKEGDIGILQSNIGDTKIRFVFTIRKKAIWIITVEESK